MSQEESLHFVPIHKVLNKPNSLMGGERELMMMAILASSVLVFLGQTWITFFLGITIWFGLSFSIRLMFKTDPKMSKVFLKQLHHQKIYEAKSTPFAGTN